MKKVRVIQIGTGHDHAACTIRSLKSLPDRYEIIGVAEPNEAFKERLKTKDYIDLPQFDAEEILKLKDVDAVCIETDELSSTYWAKRAVDLGLPVHLDKPGAPNFDSFCELVNAAKSNNVPLQMGYMYRYNPAVRRYLQEVKEGKFGKVLSVEAQMSVCHPFEKREWLSQFPGGMMFFLGCHLIDLILLFKGEPEDIISYNCCSGGDGLEGAEDYGFVVMKYKEGVSFAKSFASEVNGFDRRQLIISGEKATIELKPFEKKIIGGPDSVISTGIKETYRDNAKYIWLDCGKTYDEEPFDRYNIMMSEFADMALGIAQNKYSYDHELTLFKLLKKCCKF